MISFDYRYHLRALTCLAAAGLLIAAASDVKSQESAPARAAPATTRQAEDPRLPADQTTRFALDLTSRTLKFNATAGSIPLRNDKNDLLVEVAYIAYRLDGADAHTRPVTFVFNGGPGMASGWLQVGAIGPWRMPFAGAVPSSPPDPSPNAETWLDFTDLVFIDPPGTGYSAIQGDREDARKRFWSVDGDVEAVAEVIRRWLDRNDRIVSPKFLLGESYGGLRAPRLARALQSSHGVGVSGIVLISPLLDVHYESGYNEPFAWVDRLPSEAAAARALKGKIDRAGLADVEHYAAGEYLTDFMRGVRDKAAVARMSEHLTALTGMDRALVDRSLGRIDTDVFLRDLGRAKGQVGSIYDATVSESDPFPRRPLSFYPDPILEGLNAPVTSAMVALYATKLNWRPDRVYHLANDTAFRQWEWGRSLGRPESLSALQKALALDSHVRVLIAHGLFDLRTPYFTTARILDQLPDAGTAERVTLAVYPGGHMFYSDDTSRAAFREAARKLYTAGP